MLGLGLISMLGSASCSLQTPAPTPRLPRAQPLASGVYAVVGHNEAPSIENRGQVGNQGILIGDDGVILIDTGTSARYAEDLVATVRNLTSKPIVLAIDTHQNPAFIFGNGTFAAQGVPILAHRRVAELIRQRCEQCLKNLKQVLGSREMEGTTVTVPTRMIDGGTTLTVAGRAIDLIAFGHSSSPGSIAVIDRLSGVLFGGGLVSVDRVPDVTDADIETWIGALQALQRRRPSLVVPGEGPVAPAARIDDQIRYLLELQSEVLQTYERGISLADAASNSRLLEFAQWSQYPAMHNRNVEHLYLLLERAALDTL